MPLPIALAVFVSYVAFAATTGFAATSLGLMGAALGAVVVRGRLPVPRPLLVPLALVLGLVIFSSVSGAPSGSTLLLSTGYAVGVYLGLYVLVFMVRPNTRGETYMGLFLGCMLMLVAGSTTELHPYAELLAAQGLLLAVGLRSFAPTSAETRGRIPPPVPRWQANTWTAAAYLVALGVSAVLAFGLYRSERFLTRLLLMADMRAYAYPQRATLRELLNTSGSDRVIARVFSTYPSSYLIARCYGRYDRGGWDATVADREAPRVASPPAGADFDGPLYALIDPPPAEVDRERVERIETGVELQGTLFMPRDGTLLGVSTASIERDWAGICYLPHNTSFTGAYEVYRGQHRQDDAPLTETQRQQCLQMPGSVLVFVPALADKAAGNAVSPLQVAQAIEHWLQTSYTYGRGHALAPLEPLQTFLLQRVPAHCELFATSMVMMLRSKGIPSRYVTGFVMGERNAPGGYSVLRDENAHAWVEAYLPGLGWTSFDPTPPDGRPQIRQPSPFKQWLDVLMLQLQRWRNRLAQPDWRGMLTRVVSSIQQLGAWLIENPWRLTVLGLLFVLDLLRRSDTRAARAFRGWWRRPPPTPPSSEPLVTRLLGALTRFDAVLAKNGRPRPPASTLREVGASLRHEDVLNPQQRALATAFLERYEAARYATAAPTENQVGELEALCADLEREPVHTP